jgi:hypothetical protein
VEEREPTQVKLAIYHAVSNGYDKVQKPKAICEDVTYMAIAGACDKRHGATWNRYFKLLGAPEFAPASLYLDSNIALKVNTCEIHSWVDWLLADADIAICRHAARRCAYVEVEACLGRKKITSEQAVRAHDVISESGLPKNFGLWECGIIVRRSGVQWVKDLQAVWWAHMKASGVIRDQLWLPVAVNLMNGRIPAGRFKTIEMDVRDNKLFTLAKHA